ncbi:MAG TPA: AAA family ATPase, partial [Gemmatimonadota bacterium]|nr:AAA family ATPase [Gemmatimonadota bacterium]
MHTLRCFGRLGMEGSGGASVRLRSRKHLALLVYLVLNPDREHPRDRLASMLWETERTQARHSLSQALYDIRSNLPGARFDTTVNHVALEAGSVDSEAERFEAAVRSGDAIEAVRLYRGPFAPHLEGVATDEYERWVEDERNRLQRLAELAFYQYVIECDDRARWGEMCTAALRLLDMNPLNEEAHRAFMRGMWLQGDQHGALEHFRRIEAHLNDELPAGLSQETLRLVDRIRSSRADTAGPEPATRDRPRLVGRREEFSFLKDALGRLENGAGGVVVLHGEAGIGKTRLVEEVRDLARLRGIRTLESRCFAAESDVPYGPVVEGLAPVAADPARENGDRHSFYQLGVLFPEHFDDPGEERRDELEADAGRRRLFEETAMLLGRACDRTPRLWIVENLHWIDASSAALLHYVSRRLRDRPLLLLVSVREGEALAETTKGLVDDWCGRGRATCLELGGLSQEDVGDLVGAVRPEGLPESITATIQRLAGGNPFFALEMVSAAADLEEWGASQQSSRKLMTRGLRSLIGVRLKGLDLEAVRLLESIAILERHARPFLVARTTNMSSGRVAEIGRTLYSRGLLHDEEGRLEFPHDITREYVYSNMGELQRAALHLVAGEVLAGSEESVSPSTLARHFALGGDRPRAYEYSLRAAEQSAHSYAHTEAIDLSSLALSQSSNARERAAALKILAESESATG